MWNSNEIVSQYTKMLFVAHLKKMRFKSKNIKFKIPLNCRDVLCFHNVEFTKSKAQGQNWIKAFHLHITSYQENAFNNPNWPWTFCALPLYMGLPLINWYPMSKTQGQYRNLLVPLAAYNLKSNVLLHTNFYRNESHLKLYWRIVSHFSYKVSFF